MSELSAVEKRPEKERGEKEREEEKEGGRDFEEAVIQGHREYSAYSPTSAPAHKIGRIWREK